ncbi:unnamed protein product, partial [Lampetra fluviatilis]
ESWAPMDYRVASVRLGLWACLGRQAWTASEAFQVLRATPGSSDSSAPREIKGIRGIVESPVSGVSRGPREKL